MQPVEINYEIHDKEKQPKEILAIVAASKNGNGIWRVQAPSLNLIQIILKNLEISRPLRWGVSSAE
jgi:hypothetical protein